MKDSSEIVLEPAWVSLLRLGSEMGATDVPTAELELPPVLSAAASRAVDRALTEQDEQINEAFDDDIRRGLLFAKRCYSCGARCTPYGCDHTEDCDLDLSLSAQQRWALRNPRKRIEMTERAVRKLAIKRRWALLNGRCGYCTTAVPEPGFRWCRRCLDRAAEAQRRAYWKDSVTARAA